MVRYKLLAITMVMLMTAFLISAGRTSAIEAGEYTITEYRITTDNTDQTDSSIYNNRIVWQDNRTANRSIYLADITNPEIPVEYPIVTDVFSSSAQISGDNLVWDDSSIVWLNNVSDLESPVKYNVTPEPLWNQYNAKVFEDKMIWTDYRNGNADVYMADISNPENPIEYQITTNIEPQYASSIYGNKIVWIDNRSGISDVYMADISDPENPVEYQITNNVSTQSWADIYGNIVVWQDDRSDVADIYMANITNPSQPVEKVVAQNISYQSHPAISGNLIVWDDYRNDPDYGDIYAYNLLAEEEIRVTTNPSDQYIPSVYAVSDYEYKIAWEDLRNGDQEEYSNYDIYMAKIIFPEAADTISPTFVTLPGSTIPINLTEGQTITTNPYIIKVKPNDDNGIQRVEFYIDGTLICTATTPDAGGVYSCSWDTSKYHSDIRVIAYDNSGNPSIALTRSTVVDPSLYILPRTGMNIFDYIKYIVRAIFGR